MPPQQVKLRPGTGRDRAPLGASDKGKAWQCGISFLIITGGRPLYFRDWWGPRPFPAFLFLILLSSSSISRTSFSNSFNSSEQHSGGLIMPSGWKFSFASEPDEPFFPRVLKTRSNFCLLCRGRREPIYRIGSVRLSR